MPVWKGIIGKGFTAVEFDQYAASVVFETWRPQFVVLHNTAVPTFADWHQVSGDQRMRNLEHFYRDQQKWSAGPHVFIADDLIWVFTPLNTPGVHSPSWNALALGVELVGDYSVEPLSDGVRHNAISALATLHALLGLDPSELRLHKEDPKTTHNCPGGKIMKADFQEAILAQLGTNEHTPGAVGA